MYVDKKKIREHQIRMFHKYEFNILLFIFENIYKNKMIGWHVSYMPQIIILIDRQNLLLLKCNWIGTEKTEQTKIVQKKTTKHISIIQKQRFTLTTECYMDNWIA